MRARDAFSQVRSEVAGLLRMEEQLRAARSKAVLGPLAYTEGRGAPQARESELAALVDREAAVEERGYAIQALKGWADHVLYGTKGRCGVAKLKGHKYADAVHLRYVEALEWRSVADEMGASTRWCQMLCEAAFAYIDRVGWAYIEAQDEIECEWAEGCADE